MNKIIDTLFEDCLSRKCHFEKYEIAEFAESVRDKLGISREELAKSVADLIADENFDLVSYSLKKDFTGNEGYTREDVIFELKEYLWNYLFPENKLTIEEKLLVFDVMQVSYKTRYGEDRWILRSDLFLMIGRMIEKDFFDHDALHQEIFFAGKIEIQGNEGIDKNGYRENNTSARWISETDYSLAKFPPEIS